jgi:hypothetical protein
MLARVNPATADTGSICFPGCEVEVSGDTTLDAHSVGFTVVGERSTQIVLPAAEHALQQAFCCIVKNATPLFPIFNKLLIDCDHALHPKLPQLGTEFLFLEY